MSDANTADILKALLREEQKSLAPRLNEATLFISPEAVEEQFLVQRMAAACRENCEKLNDAIFDLQDVPWPPTVDVSTADLHYQEMHHVLPRLVADQESLVRAYESAGGRIRGNPRASALVTSILEQHRADLEALHALRNLAPQAAQ